MNRIASIVPESQLASSARAGAGRNEAIITPTYVRNPNQGTITVDTSLYGPVKKEDLPGPAKKVLKIATYTITGIIAAVILSPVLVICVALLVLFSPLLIAKYIYEKSTADAPNSSSYTFVKCITPNSRLRS